MRVADDPETAVRSADIISCATLSTAPIVQGAWLPPGVHLDLVGAFRRNMRETDDAAMARADVLVVDDREAALAEGGDIVQAIASGAIAADRIRADLRDLARGAHPGRTREDEITAFKSVGFALELPGRRAGGVRGDACCAGSSIADAEPPAINSTASAIAARSAAMLMMFAISKSPTRGIVTLAG